MNKNLLNLFLFISFLLPDIIPKKIMNKKTLIGLVLVSFLIIVLITTFFHLMKENKLTNKTNTSLANPASVYCQEEGGKLEIRNFLDGQKGFCIFSDGSECEEWSFYKKECQKGEKFCKNLCGDGVCQEIVCQSVGCPCPETIENCPQDCKKEGEINCAKEGERVNRNPFLGDTSQKCCQGLFEWRKSKSYSICLKSNPEGIIIENPKEEEKIKSPLKISGKAKGNWFFEANFTAELYDENNNYLGGAILTAKDNWATENFVPFEGTLEFSTPETNSGKLCFFSANPAGLPENQKFYEMPVAFEKPGYQKVLLYYYNPNNDKDNQGNIKCSRDGLVAIERQIPISKTPIKDTIELLLKGKENLSEEDLQKGITSEFPLEGFKLKSLNLKEDGTLILEFEDPLNKTVGGACRVGILWFQIEKTAKQFNQVKEVKFLPETLFQP